MPKTLVVIPSRLESVRLPRKPLAQIADRPMVAWVLKHSTDAAVGNVVVATCGEEIANTVEQHGGKAIITSPSLPSGTDRVWAAYQAMGAPDVDVIINVQGDLPFVNPAHLQSILNPFKDSSVDVATIAAPITDLSEINNPNVVKIAMDTPKDGIARAVYFSRQAIPANAISFYHHIGVYAYRPKALESFVSQHPCYLELTEKLEQLRFLQHGFRIDVAIVNEPPLSVDTQDDLNRAIESAKNYV